MVVNREELMKKISIITFSILLCVCCGCEKKEKAAIKIGHISVTSQEFNDAFEQGRFQGGVELSRKDFLDYYITRKLILKEAEDMGLDNDPQILKALQLFWEQTLLKLALARKINEITVPIKIDENQVRATYEQNKDTEFSGKDLAQAQEEIKLRLFREKQQHSLQEWTQSLKKNKRIVADYKLLGIQ